MDPRELEMMKQQAAMGGPPPMPGQGGIPPEILAQLQGQMGLNA